MHRRGLRTGEDTSDCGRQEEGQASSSADRWRPGRRLPPGAVIKPSIWLWGRLITQPDPQNETAMSLETRSHVGGRLKPPKSQRLRAEGEC